MCQSNFYTGMHLLHWMLSQSIRNGKSTLAHTGHLGQIDLSCCNDCLDCTVSGYWCQLDTSTLSGISSLERIPFPRGNNCQLGRGTSSVLQLCWGNSNLGDIFSNLREIRTRQCYCRYHLDRTFCLFRKNRNRRSDHFSEAHTCTWPSQCTSIREDKVICRLHYPLSPDNLWVRCRGF